MYKAHETIYNEPDVVKNTEPDSKVEDLDEKDDEINVEKIDDEINLDNILEDDDTDDDDLLLGDLLMEDDAKDEPEDFVEEKTTADGTHIRKEVH